MDNGDCLGFRSHIRNLGNFHLIVTWRDPAATPEMTV